MKILFAEDEQTSYMILEAILRKWGYTPVGVNDGRAAWEILQKPDAPKMVILDWNMPEMDGPDICCQLREKESANPPYIILLTGRSEKSDIVQGLDAGANDFISKPYNNEELLARIRVGQRVLELQAQLAEREERYRMLVENTPDFIFSIDKNCRYTAVNQSFCQALGKEARQIIGKTQAELGFSQEIVDKFSESCRKVLESGAAVKIETVTPMPDGRIHYYENVLLPVLNEDQTVTTIRGTSRDITERKKTEEIIYEYTRELERKSNELAELYGRLDAEVDKARRIHERTLEANMPEVDGVSFAAYYNPAEKLGGDFYSIIKRDHKIIMYLSDVTGHGLDGAMTSIFIKSTIEDYTTLNALEDITPGKIARYLTQKYHQDNYPDDYFVCLFIVVFDTETMVMKYSGYGFQTPPLAVVGGRQLELLSKEMPISSAFPVDLLGFREDQIRLVPGSTVFLITDGLPEQEAQGVLYENRLKKLFYDYHQLKPDDLINKINQDYQQFSDGTLQGDDDITFLVLQVDADFEKYRQDYTYQQVKILLVEDNPMNQKLLLALLKKKDWEVIVAGNGQEALDALAEDDFNLVLMDVQMPVMDGFEATARIREQEKVTGEHLPIVAMTAHALKGYREKCLEAGMDEYTTKPVNTARLYHIIEEILSNQQEEALIMEKLYNEEMPLSNEKEDETVSDEINSDEICSDEIYNDEYINDEYIDDEIINGDETGSDEIMDDLLNESDIIDDIICEIEEEAAARVGNSKTAGDSPSDLRMMMEQMGGDLNILEKVVEAFIDGIPASLEKLQSSFSARDAETFAREAHTIKGVMGNMGSPRVADLAYELEKAGKKGELAGKQENVSKLIEEIHIVIKFFTETKWQETLK